MKPTHAISGALPRGTGLPPLLMLGISLLWSPLICAAEGGGAEVTEAPKAPPDRKATKPDEASKPHPCVTYAAPAISSKILEHVRKRGLHLAVDIQQQNPTNQLVTISGLIHVDVAPEFMWKVVRDYEAYQKFLPRVTKSRAGKWRNRKVEISLIIDVPWPIPDIVTHTRQVHDECGPSRWLVRWDQVEGSLWVNRGAALVYPAPYGGTLVRQRFELGTQSAFPSEVLVSGAHRYFRFLLEAFRDQVHRAKKNGWY